MRSKLKAAYYPPGHSFAARGSLQALENHTHNGMNLVHLVSHIMCKSGPANIVVYG